MIIVARNWQPTSDACPREPHGSAPDSRTALRDWLTEQLADLLGEPLADVRALADDDDLLGCGLDSIRLMYLQERLRARGSTLDFAQLAQRPCLGPGSTCWPARTGCPPRQRSLPAAQDRDQPFELSSVQQAYWLGRGAGEVLGNVSCHAFLEFRARDVDPQRLAAAAECVRQRHPMLRARFDGRQQILPTPPLSCFDLGLAHFAGGRGRARLAGAARLARP